MTISIHDELTGEEQSVIIDSLKNELKHLERVSVALADVRLRFVSQFKKLRFKVKSLKQYDYFLQQNRNKKFDFFSDIIKLSSAHSETLQIFNGDTEYLPYFIQTPQKRKVINNISLTSRGSLLFDKHLNDN